MGKSVRSETILIENAILSFPHLFQPQIPQGASDPKYSAAFLVDEATAQRVYAEAQKIAQGAFKNGEQNLQKFRWPVSKAADKQSNNGSYPYRDNPRTANLYLINANASVEYPPQVVDQNRQSIIDRGAIYAGCVVAAGIQLFSYNTAGNVGIGVGLTAVMKQADGDSLGGGKVDTDKLFANVQAQAPAAGPLPGGAPASQGQTTPFGQPTQAPAPGMPAAPFGQPADKPPFL